MHNFICTQTLCINFRAVLANCRRKAPNNINSVKFTSLRGDNSTTNDSMVMKTAHAQLHMYTNIRYKFQNSTCKTVGEMLRTTLIQQNLQVQGEIIPQPKIVWS